MNTFINYFLCLLFLSFSILSGCNDDASEQEPEIEKDPYTEAQLLLTGQESKSWVLETVTLNNIDVTQFYLESCDRDNPYVLYQNGKGELQSGEESCKEDEPEILAIGNWELNEDLVTLSIKMGEMSRDFTILELSEETLKVEMVFEGQNLIATYKAVE